MKRLLCMLLSGFLVFVLVGCGGGEPTAQAEATEEMDTTAEEVAEEEPAEEESAEEDAPEEEPTEEPEAVAQAEESEEEEPATETEGSLLQTVLDRGNLICGVNGGLAGFGVLEDDGTYSGFDVEFCRAVAAAIFGDPDAVEFVPLSAQERFTAVQAGSVDVLFRNTTHTLSRDTTVFLDFGPTIFYDGQGMMVRESLAISTLEELNAATICVQSGTTTELNLTDQFRTRGIEFEPLVFEDIDATYTAYDEERCDAVTSDRSQLLARRTTLQNPDEHVILDVVMSKEPLAPAVTQGDSQWKDVVAWSVYATIQAEEFGINSTNVGDFLDSENPDIARFLGAEGDLGVGLGLNNDFTINIIENVGNYGEIYNRNLGPDTAFDLVRGPNAIWTDGGLLYSPPFR